ncbi:hypothetical protein Nepgr_031733 [Nepenthes gracilis]|uniref:Uncharacterized protein n=1 Tax=Nepenthes gracilis TaxID=150966 RepID=A0AAD3THX2_NEPGR|nr:hypothetical protein Nepgr_031733 [Nepenthes gracilis]
MVIHPQNTPRDTGDSAKGHFQVQSAKQQHGRIVRTPAGEAYKVTESTGTERIRATLLKSHHRSSTKINRYTWKAGNHSQSIRKDFEIHDKFKQTLQQESSKKLQSNIAASKTEKANKTPAPAKAEGSSGSALGLYPWESEPLLGALPIWEARLSSNADYILGMPLMIHYSTDGEVGDAGGFRVCSLQCGSLLC